MLIGVAAYPELPGRKQAMEMTEHGKGGKPRCRLPTLPTLFGNPFGIPTFPRPRRLDICLLVPHSTRTISHRKGLVTDVSGPQRNACPGTLTPLSVFCFCRCFSEHQGRRCGQERDCYETLRMDSDPPLALLTAWCVFTDAAVGIGAIRRGKPREPQML